jgi:hypothetical protein
VNFPHTSPTLGYHRWSITYNVTSAPRSYAVHVRLPPVEHNLQRHPYATVTHTRPTSGYHRWSITANVTPTPRSPTCARHTYMAHVTLTLCSYSHTPNYLILHPYPFLMKYPLKLVERRIPAMAPSILLHPYTFLMKYPLKLVESRIPAMAPSILLYLTHVTLTLVETNLQRHPHALVANLWTSHIHRPR